jgi:AcrR family transcriptional regulator
MTTPEGQVAKAGRPPRLSRDGIVAAAARVVDADGIDGLSMRRIARELNCSPMALYRHVNDRADLLRLLLDHITATLRRPAASEDPRRTITRVATKVHDWLAAHPWAIDVLAAHRWSVSWITHDLTAAFLATGLSPLAAARACEVVWHHLVGELVTRHAHPAGPSAPTATAPDLTAMDPVLLGHAVTARSHDQFLLGLTALLDGLVPPPSLPPPRAAAAGARTGT